MKTKAKVYLAVLNMQVATTAQLICVVGYPIYDVLDELSDWEIEDVGGSWIPGTKPRFNPLECLTPEEVFDLVNDIIEIKKQEYQTKHDDLVRRQL